MQILNLAYGTLAQQSPLGVDIMAGKGPQAASELVIRPVSLNLSIFRN